MTVCVDACLIVRYLTGESGIEVVNAWFEAHENDRLVAPSFMAAEVATALLRKTKRGELDSQHGEAALGTLFRIDIDLVWDHQLVHRAYEIARELDTPTVYDCLYVALAEREHCDFWTTDVCFARAAASRYPFVRLLE